MEKEQQCYLAGGLSYCKHGSGQGRRKRAGKQYLVGVLCYVNLKDALTRLFERKQDSLKRLAETLTEEAVSARTLTESEEAAPIQPELPTPTEAQCQEKRV